MSEEALQCLPGTVHLSVSGLELQLKLLRLHSVVGCGHAYDCFRILQEYITYVLRRLPSLYCSEFSKVKFSHRHALAV